MSRCVRAPLAGVVCLAALLPASAARAQSQPSTAAAVATAAAAVQQPAAPQPAALPKAPIPNRLNEVLPTWLRVRGEFRERVEGFDSLGFTPDRDDTYSLSRFRVNATVTPSSARPSAKSTIAAQTWNGLHLVRSWR